MIPSILEPVEDPDFSKEIPELESLVESLGLMSVAPNGSYAIGVTIDDNVSRGWECILSADKNRVEKLLL